MTTATTTASGQGYAPAACSAFVRVAVIAPFWRYAVGPTAAHSPAIPCYTLKAAEALFAEVQRKLPWAGAILYRRRGWSSIEMLREYRPNTALKGADEGGVP